LSCNELFWITDFQNVNLTVGLKVVVTIRHLYTPAAKFKEESKKTGRLRLVCYAEIDKSNVPFHFDMRYHNVNLNPFLIFQRQLMFFFKKKISDPYYLINSIKNSKYTTENRFYKDKYSATGSINDFLIFSPRYGQLIFYFVSDFGVDVILYIFKFDSDDDLVIFPDLHQQ